MGKFALVLVAVLGASVAEGAEPPAAWTAQPPVARVKFRQRATVTTCTGPTCTVPGPQVAAGPVPALVPVLAGECVNGSCSAPATAAGWYPGKLLGRKR